MAIEYGGKAIGNVIVVRSAKRRTDRAGLLSGACVWSRADGRSGAGGGRLSFFVGRREPARDRSCLGESGGGQSRPKMRIGLCRGTKREYFRSGSGRFPVVSECAILRRGWTCGSWQDNGKKLRDRREGGRLASACKGSRNRLPFCVTVYKIPRLTKIWNFFKRRLHLCRNML